MPTRDRITLKGMQFHTRVGVLPHERDIPQPLQLDVTVWLSLKQPGESDSFRDALDYRRLYGSVVEAVGEDHHRLLEALCEKVAVRVLSLPGAEAVRVAARKPHAPIDGPLDYVEVVIERRKENGVQRR